MAAGGIIQQVYTEFETVVKTVVESASSGISGYVIPIAWIVLAIALLMWCYLTMSGKTTVPILDWFVPFISFMLVLYAMGSGYMTWVGEPLWALPDELASAANHASTSGPIEAIGNFENKMLAIGTGMIKVVVKYFETGAWGAAIVLVILLVAIMLAAVVVVIVVFVGLVYAKLGLSMVLAVGPFFLFILVIPALRDKFFSWLSTALYFVMYSVLIQIFMQMFFSILDKYVSKLTGAVSGDSSSWMPTAAQTVSNMFLGGDAAKATNALVTFMPIIILSFIMAFLFLQITTIASSMTAGSGGTVGAGVSRAVYALRFFLRK